jgi:septal ring factor EnvC (AmiA/AmiB activator)
VKHAARIGFFVAAMLWTATSVFAQNDLEFQARQAQQSLGNAWDQLERSKSAKDRIAALTGAILSFEESLSLARDSLRQISVLEARAQQKLTVEEESYSELIGVLLSIDKSPIQAELLHPDGPMATARGGMLIADLLPAIEEKVQSLRSDLEAARYLSELQNQLTLDLQAGLVALQETRAALGRAIADRDDLPKRFIEDTEQTAILVTAADTLDIFASGLSLIAIDEAAGTLPDITIRKGTLPMPVRGKVIRYFNEADAAGIKRPGIVVGTSDNALVRTPTAATIRYRGPLLDYGLVSILEPQQDILYILAGLGTVYGDIGEVLPAGSPVGLMGTSELFDKKNLIETLNESGGLRGETLYIEVRVNKAPENPLMWFEEFGVKR